MEGKGGWERDNRRDREREREEDRDILDILTIHILML